MAKPTQREVRLLDLNKRMFEKLTGTNIEFAREIIALEDEMNAGNDPAEESAKDKVEPKPEPVAKQGVSKITEMKVETKTDDLF